MTENALISTSRNFVGWESARGTASTLNTSTNVAQLNLYSNLPFTNISIESRPITVQSSVSTDFNQPETEVRQDYIGTFSTGFIPGETSGYSGTAVRQTQSTDMFLLSAMRSQGYFGTAGRLTATALSNTNVLTEPRTIELYKLNDAALTNGLPPRTHVPSANYVRITDAADTKPDGTTRFVRIRIPNVWADTTDNSAIGTGLISGVDDNLAGLLKNKFLKLTLSAGSLEMSDFVVSGTRTAIIKAVSFFRTETDRRSLIIDMFPSYPDVSTNRRVNGLVDLVTRATTPYATFRDIRSRLVQASNIDSGLTFITESDTLEINTDRNGYNPKREVQISSGHIINNLSLSYGQSTPVEMTFETRYAAITTGAQPSYDRTDAARDSQFTGNLIFPSGTTFNTNRLLNQTIQDQIISTVSVRNFTISQYNGTGDTFDTPRYRNINCTRLVLNIAGEVTPIITVDGLRRNPANALTVSMEATIAAEDDQLYRDSRDNTDVSIDLEMFTLSSKVLYVMSIPRAKLRTSNHVPIPQSNRREYRVQITSVPVVYNGNNDYNNFIGAGGANNTGHANFNNRTNYFNLFKFVGLDAEAMQSDNFYSN